MQKDVLINYKNHSRIKIYKCKFRVNFFLKKNLKITKEFAYFSIVLVRQNTL